MAIDYSIKGKGTDRKTVRVVNEYQYDEKGNILVRPWDSDIDYLYGVTVRVNGKVFFDSNVFSNPAKSDMKVCFCEPYSFSHSKINSGDE